MQTSKEISRHRHEPVKEFLIGTLVACCPNELPNMRESLLVIGLESAVLLGK